MRPAKNHRVVAAIMDIFVIGSIMQAVGTILIALTSLAESMMLWVPLILYFAAIIIFHAAIARRVRFCTPGETMTGCKVDAVGKSWWTIYTKPRWFLFVTLLILLLGPANAFDRMQDANRYPLPQVAGKTIFVCVSLLAIYRIALGRFGWAVALYLVLIPRFIGACVALNLVPELARIGIVFHGVQLLCLTIAIMVYQDRVEEDEGEPASEIVLLAPGD